MTRAIVTPPHHEISSAQAEIDQEVRHIRDLVFIRRLLWTRGATEAELREYDATINGARIRLAQTAKRASARFAAAA